MTVWASHRISKVLSISMHAMGSTKISVIPSNYLKNRMPAILSRGRGAVRAGKRLELDISAVRVTVIYVTATGRFNWNPENH
jgi:hypothetical protein